MPLDQNLIQKIRQMANCSVEKLDEQLTDLADKDAAVWRQAVNVILLTLWVKCESADKRSRVAAAGLKEIQNLLNAITQQAQMPQQATQAPDAPMMPLPQPGAEVMIGADGAPITDPTQIEAERLMNAAAGPRSGGPPMQMVPQQRQAPAQRRGRPRGAPPQATHLVGADGRPNDEEQANAEALMDEVAGPRQ